MEMGKRNARRILCIVLSVAMLAGDAGLTAYASGGSADKDILADRQGDAVTSDSDCTTDRLEEYAEYVEAAALRKAAVPKKAAALRCVRQHSCGAAARGRNSGSR